MASLTTVNKAQTFDDKFSFKNMKSFVEYLTTRACKSVAQTLNASQEENLKNTANVTAFLCGQPFYLEDETELDISACTAGTETAWASGTSYTAGDVVKNGNNDDRYFCILAHDGADNSDSDVKCNEPGESDSWARYWEQRKHTAVNAAGTSITKKYEQWFLITAIEDGTNQIWESGDEAVTATATAECKVPWFDPKTYVPVAFVHVVNATSSALVIGTATTGDFNLSSVTSTFLNLTVPVFPHPDYWDKN